jgi:methylglyoxal synthase
VFKDDGKADRKLTLAITAHDSKKEDILSLMVEHEENLSKLALFATSNTGKLVQNHTKLMPTLLNRDHMGGDLQIGGLVASGIINAVIFLRDPLLAQTHEPEISALLRVCEIYNVPLATNTASAQAILYLLFDHPEILEKHSFETHLNNELFLSFDE